MSHDPEDWCKIWRKTDVVSKMTRIWWILTWALKSQNLHFQWFLLCKVFNIWPKKVRRSYLSWHWRVIENLERNQHVVSKLTWGIWRILTRALENLKNFDFNGLFLSRAYIVWAKKVQRSYLSWHWRVIQNLERNRLVIWKLTWGIWQILTWSLESLKNIHFNGLLLSKVYIVWTKKVQRSYLSRHWRVIQNSERNWLVVCFKTDMRNLTNFDMSTWKFQKNFPLIGSFWAKYILFELKEYRGVIFHDTEEW